MPKKSLFTAEGAFLQEVVQSKVNSTIIVFLWVQDNRLHEPQGERLNHIKILRKQQAQPVRVNTSTVIA